MASSTMVRSTLVDAIENASAATDVDTDATSTSTASLAAATATEEQKPSRQTKKHKYHKVERPKLSKLCICKQSYDSACNDDCFRYDNNLDWICENIFVCECSQMGNKIQIDNRKGASGSSFFCFVLGLEFMSINKASVHANWVFSRETGVVLLFYLSAPIIRFDEKSVLLVGCFIVCWYGKKILKWMQLQLSMESNSSHSNNWLCPIHNKHSDQLDLTNIRDI